MTSKHRLCGAASLGVYSLAVCLLVLFLLIGNNDLALILSPTLPLILLSGNARRLGFICDFRVIYLSSIFIWSFGKSLSVFMAYGHSGIKGDSVELYMASMVLSPILVLFFRVPSVIYFTKFTASRGDTKILVFAMAIWLLSIFMVYISLVGLVSESTTFVLTHLAQGFALVFASIIIMLLYRGKSIWHVCLLLAVTVFTIYVYIQGALNRTSFLLPVMVLAAAAFFQSNLPVRRIQSTRFISVSIIIVPFLALLLFMGDLQKQLALSLPAAIEFAASRPEIILDVIVESNYLPTENYARDYFNSISAIIESKAMVPGGLLYQLVSSVMPRIFFPEKGDTDLAKVMWDQGLIPQRLYYEIYLEPVIDSGIFGVIMYYSLFLFFVRISLVSVTTYYKGFHGVYSRSVYILNLIILFLIIRGPVIFLVLYGLLPNLVLWWWLLRKRLRLFRALPF